MSVQNSFRRQKSNDRVRCYVPGCESRPQKHLNLSFHIFPKPGSRDVNIQNAFGAIEKIDKFTIWKKVLRIKGNVPARAKVCSSHFVEKHFFHPGKYRL